MAITIRRAQSSDIHGVIRLLEQVLELHAKLRPDIFIPGTTKYTPQELEDILRDDNSPVFAAVDDNGGVVGYAFCVLKRQPFSTNMRDFTTLYIDDLCVDENCRGQQVGTSLFSYVKQFAKEQGCYDVTLNVWEGNDPARRFYEKMGMFVKETQMEILL
ncbi:MAG: GNAT family N-acetyltransferase [Oscillospiraceae bacterium]